MTFLQLIALYSNIFATIATLKPQAKSAGIDNIHAHITKIVDFEKISKGNLQERIKCFISNGKVIHKMN